MAGTKDIKDFTKYPSLSGSDYLLGTKTDLGGTDAGITVSAFTKQVAQDVKPEIKNGYWWVLGINTGQLAIGKTPKFRYGPTGLEMKYEGEDDAAYVLIIPLSDLMFSFDKLTPDQILQFKLKFSDLTEADKLELRGEAFTYDMFTDEQLNALRLTWDKLTPAQKLEIRGERGYSAFEIWTQREGNASKTEEEYLTWLREPATDAAAEVRKEMVQISEDVNQTREKLVEDAGKVNTDLTTAVGALEERAETVISETNTVKEAAEEAVINADNATAAANGAASLANTAAKDTNKATELAVVAAKLAGEKAEQASSSADKADTAAGAADDAAALANEKATLANNAAGVADTATGKANTAIGNAETATKRANDAAEAAEGVISGVRPDWAAGRDSPNYIKNKPEIPTLQVAPGTDTINYVNTDGTLTTYRIGDEVRVLEDDEYVFYRLYDLSDGIASWQESGSGTALPGNIYLQGATYYNESVRIIKKGYLNE